MRYVRAVETSKRVTVEVVRLNFRKSWSRFGQLAKTALTSACEWAWTIIAVVVIQ